MGKIRMHELPSTSISSSASPSFNATQLSGKWRSPFLSAMRETFGVIDYLLGSVSFQ